MAISPGEPRTIPAATESRTHQAGSPMFHGYQVEIPAGWQALRPVFYPVPDAPGGSGAQDSLAAVTAAMQRFRAGVLLCRPETDGQEAAREFQAGVLLEAAFLTQDGQFVQSAPERPAYGVLPLAVPSSMSLGQPGSGECLVLLPLIRFPPEPGEVYPPIRMFVDGREVNLDPFVGSPLLPRPSRSKEAA